MATTQFNVRVNAAEKIAGDEALASVDYSPSRMVQSVWGYAARNKNNKKALRKLTRILEESTQPAEDSVKEKRLKWANEGPRIFINALKEMGIQDLSTVKLPNDEDLLYQAYLDKMDERGMPA